MQDAFDPILSEEELAKWLDTSRPTLQRQRSEGSGPPFVQLSERRIGYRNPRSNGGWRRELSIAWAHWLRPGKNLKNRHHNPTFPSPLLLLTQK